jgi:hypothetical protein
VSRHSGKLTPGIVEDVRELLLSCLSISTVAEIIGVRRSNASRWL